MTPSSSAIRAAVRPSACSFRISISRAASAGRSEVSRIWISVAIPAANWGAITVSPRPAVTIESQSSMWSDALDT